MINFIVNTTISGETLPHVHFIPYVPLVNRFHAAEYNSCNSSEQDPIYIRMQYN